MYTFTVNLVSPSSGQIIDNPSIEDADFTISTDGGSLSPLTISPEVIDSTSLVQIQLTDQEIGVSNFVVYISDSNGNAFRDMYYHEQSAQAKLPQPAGPKSALPHVYPADGSVPTS